MDCPFSPCPRNAGARDHYAKSGPESKTKDASFGREDRLKERSDGGGVDILKKFSATAIALLLGGLAADCDAAVGQPGLAALSADASTPSHAIANRPGFSLLALARTARRRSRSQTGGVPKPATPCGGEERWPVKMGTDDDAASVDLNNVDDRHTVAALNAAPRPRELDDPQEDLTLRRVNSCAFPETKVYRIKGWLRFWKYEKVTRPNQKGVDGDFHVVVTQERDSDFAHASEEPTGESVVVEFPSPACVTGRNEEYAGRPASHFVNTGLRDGDMGLARKRFEDLIVKTVRANGSPDCTIDRCELTPNAAIPVYVTGVGFFDFSHGQIGRAVNVFELHPVLAIEPRILRR